MKKTSFWLLLIAIALARTLPLEPSRSNEAVAREKKEKKEKKKRKEAKVVKADKETQWEWQRKSPWSDFLWMARQLPDFRSLVSSTTEIAVSAVAARGKEMLFVDGCKLVHVKKSWKVSGCQMATLGENDFLSKLVRKGADVTPNPNSLAHLETLVKAIRTAREPADLNSLAPSSVKNEAKGNRLIDQIQADYKTCGKKRFIASIQSLPTPEFVGENLVVIEVGYTHVSNSKTNRVSASFARTKKGWTLGKLRIQCM